MFKRLKKRTHELVRNKIKLTAFILLCAAITCAFTVVPINLWIMSGIETFGITSIRGDSMSPTIENNGVLYYQPTKFARGEIVVVNCPSTDSYTHATGVQLLKRIVGLPGETLEITDDGVIVNGELLVEDYIDNENKTLRDTNEINEIILSDGEYFLLGDNRINSFDSRHFGAIHQTEFLYGLTTEPNEYTYGLWTNAALIAVSNLIGIIILPILCFVLMTMKNDNKKHAIANESQRYNLNLINDGCALRNNKNNQYKDLKKKSQPRSKKNQRKDDRVKRAQRQAETNQFIKVHKKS
jgi:signal peptidase I